MNPLIEIVSNSSLKLSSFITNIFKIHNQLLFREFDPVKDDSSGPVTFDPKIRRKIPKIQRNFPENCQNFQKPPTTINHYYWSPFALVTYIICDVLYVFSRAKFKYSPTGMPQLFTHLIYPPEYWRQGDPMIGLAIVMTFIIYACLLVDPMLDSRYFLYISEVDRKSKTAILFQNGKSA